MPISFRTAVYRIKEAWHIALGGEQGRLEAMAGAPGVWTECQEFQIAFLRRMGLQPHHTLLDIGCGPLRGGIPVIRYLEPGNYTGIDIRPAVVAEAQRQIAKAGLQHKQPAVLVSASFGRDELGDRQFDFIWCFQLLYHLEDEQVDQCFSQVVRFMHRESVCLANVNTTEPPSHWKGFPFVQRPLEFYESLAARHGLRMRNLGQLRDWGYTRKVAGQFNHMLEFRKR